MSKATANRRLETLIANGAVYVRAILDPELRGVMDGIAARPGVTGLGELSLFAGIFRRSTVASRDGKLPA